MICTVKGRQVLISDSDKAIFDKFNWHINDSGYVVWRGILDGKKRTIRLHRLIAHADDDQIVDHINRNKLDNRRENLRICTQAENVRNTEAYEKAKGYYFDNNKKRWAIDSKRFKTRSLYMDSEEACRQYIQDLKDGKTPKRVFTRRKYVGKLLPKVEYIVEQYNLGRTYTDIANELGVYRTSVARAAQGITYMRPDGKTPRISRRSKRGPAKKDNKE